MKLHLLVMLLPLTLTAYSAKAYDGEYCREFTKKVRVGGQLQNAYGTACYRPDGSWEVVQEPRIRTQPGRMVYSDSSNARDWDDERDEWDQRGNYNRNRWDRDDWRRRPPMVVNMWEDRWSPAWQHPQPHWRKPCHRNRYYGYGPRYHRGNDWNISYSF